MTRDLLLGLDLGTTTSKALLLDASGAEVAVAVAPTPFRSSDGRIEASVEDLLATAAGLVAEVGRGAGERVAAVGIAGMAECGAPLDASGAVLAPVISWHDPRGEDVVQHLIEQFGDAIGLRTGQRPRSVSSVAKLGWLMADGCDPAGWLGVPELCLWNLTATQATEHSLASRTGCYDVLERLWLDDIAAAAGFSTAVFADVLAAGTVMGKVSRQAAARWGLPEGIPVTLAGHDHLAGAVGAGARPGDLVNSVGTAETVLGSTRTRPDLRRALDLRTPVSVAPGGAGWVVLAGAARAGVVLAAAADLLGHTMPDLDAMAEDATAVDVARLVGGLQAGRSVTMPEQPPGAIWRGLLHALAQRTAEAAGRVCALAPGERMLVIGGGSQSRPWISAKAELIALELVVPRTSQAVARGAAVFAGVAAGWWSSPQEAPVLEVRAARGQRG